LVHAARATTHTLQYLLDSLSALRLHAWRRLNRRYIRPGLRMTGPAAIDYILANRPVLH
jgi:hypothetical protein